MIPFVTVIHQSSFPINTNYSQEIYIVCLASYNKGILYGKWIDANQDSSDLENEVQEILAESPEPTAEEWAIGSS